MIEAAAFALRWLHVVAAIAWIGESFYFVMLDRSLTPTADPGSGLVGESWSVHGGGFYHKRKYMPAPAQLPEVLHWSKWKSYTTWLSGFALFAVLYLSTPNLYLIDPAVAALSPAQAIGIAFAFLLLGWFVYDGLCRALASHPAALGAALSVLVLLLCYGATHLFAGGAAFLLVGATLATLMSGNFFFVIIPGQKRLVAALKQGQLPDPLAGLRGKQRSVHNTYFTLPVLFAMLSNHYPIAYAHEHSWLILAVFMAVGAAIRQFFVLWHGGQRAWWLLAGSALALLGVFAYLAPPQEGGDPARSGVAAPMRANARLAETAMLVLALPSTTSEAPHTATARPVAPLATDTPAIHAIVQQRCGACHSAHPSLVASAPKGVMFDSPAQLQARAAMIYRQAVQLRVMPPGNMTHLSEAERAAIARWYETSPDVVK